MIPRPLNITTEDELQVEDQVGAHTGVSYTELPAAHTRIHRETVHVATVYRYTVCGPNTGVRYTERILKSTNSQRIVPANCTELDLKKDQQLMKFFGGGE